MGWCLYHVFFATVKHLQDIGRGEGCRILRITMNPRLLPSFRSGHNRSMLASVPPMIMCWVLTGTSQALNSARYWSATCAIPSRPLSDPNTSLMNALGSLAGVSVFHSPWPDHQKMFLNSASRPLILVKVEPL